MPRLFSASKAAQSLVFESNGFRQLRHVKVGCLSSIAGLNVTSSLDDLIYKEKCLWVPLRRFDNAVQSRRFRGFGNGGTVGDDLHNNFEERRVIGYSPEQLFAVVAAVDLYEDFLPWCQRSKIVKHNADGSFDAEMEIGFKFFVERYVSHVEVNKPKSIKTTVSDSRLLGHLINQWEFNPGPVAGTCDHHFLVDFKFQSPLYTQMASMFFKEVVSCLIASFCDRCRLIYGPRVQVLKTTYGEQRM